MRNVTNTNSQEFHPRELLDMARDARERQAPGWVSRELENQAIDRTPRG